MRGQSSGLQEVGEDTKYTEDQRKGRSSEKIVDGGESKGFLREINSVGRMQRLLITTGGGGGNLDVPSVPQR